MVARGRRIAGPLLVVLTLALASACGSPGQTALSQPTSGSSVAEGASESGSVGPTDHQAGEDQDDRVRVRQLDRCPAPSPADPSLIDRGVSGAVGQHLPAVTLPSDSLRDTLAELIAIPSVSADAAHADE